MKNKMHTSRATAVGGRSGHVTSEDGALDVDVRMPGTPGSHLNPETMFAGGYAACFDNAIISILQHQKRRGVTHETTVAVTLGELESGGYGFDITIEVAFAGMDTTEAEALVQQAHQVCPYSNAIRNNVNVALAVKTLTNA